MRKHRIDLEGPAPITRLKQLPEEDLDFLWDQRDKMSAVKMIANIRARHGIEPLSEPRLSEFWRWLGSQRALREMNQDAEQFRDQFSQENPAASLEEAHEATLAFLHLKAGREDNEKLMRFVLGEIRKARAVTQNDVRIGQSDRRIKILEQNAASAKAKLEDVKSKGGITPEVLRQIEEAAKLL